MLISAALLTVLGACSSDPSPPADARASVAPEARAEARPAERGAADLAPADLAPCKLVKPYSTKNAVCNQCAESRCCVELNACLGSPDCDDAYVNCTLACALGRAPDAGVSACLDQCAKAHPKGKLEYDAAIGCADSKCAAECS
jgi:hypothetical protein